MKIAVVTSCSIKLFPGIDHTPLSISAITYNLTEELVKMGHDVTLFATSDSITSAKLADNLLKSTDHKLKNFNYNNPIHNKLLHQHFEKAVLQGDNFDIIYGDTEDIIPYSKLTPTPTVVTMHGPSISKARLFFKNEKIIALSKNQIQNNPDLNFIGMVYNGINISNFIYNDTPDDYLVWLGRITPIKGTLEAIEVAKKAGKKLILAGNIDNNEKEYVDRILQEVQKNKLLEYVGEVDMNEKNHLLKKAIATLMPIQWEEPFGLVAIESMACGTPVIAFNRGALPEIIQDKKTGFIVKTEKEMIDAVKNIDKIDRQICRQHIERSFTIQKMAEKYDKIFKQIIKTK
ncbi:glycosyltransferase family 4 protein [bacterium]|nr:MAG: glycosyltransferase family 4 protein [bacterium]